MDTQGLSSRLPFPFQLTLMKPLDHFGFPYPIPNRLDVCPTGEVQNRLGHLYSNTPEETE